MLSRSLLLKLAENKAMESFVRRNPLAARSALRFIAGETVEESIGPVRELNSHKVAVSLDFLGESVSNREEVDATIKMYQQLLAMIRREKLNANISVKLTALGLDIDPLFCEQNLKILLESAGPDGFIRVDMEGSAYTQSTLDLFFRIWDGPEAYRNLGIVIQAYMRRSADDIDRLIASKVRVRLCKGAYLEPPELAFPEKSDVDANYVRLMERLLKEGNYPGIATHDTNIIDHARKYVKDNKIGNEQFEFQMLHGIRRDLQKSLAAQGYGMRVYMPFGSHWYPYLMRRLAERPANIWFILKNVFHS